MEGGVSLLKHRCVKIDVSNEVVASGWLVPSGKNALPLYFKLPPIENKYI